MKKIKNEIELKDAIGENDAVVVKFGADWCGPCRVIEKSIENIEQSYVDTALFLEVNVDEADEDFVANSGIRNIPVLQYFKNGEMVDKTVGLITEQDIINKIKELKGE
jgi:thioredoxin 1